MRLLAIVAVLGVLAPAATVRADPPLCLDEPPPDDEVVRRLDWIERAIDRDEDDVRRWYSVFVVAHTLLAGVNVALAFGVDTQSTMDQEAWWHTAAAPSAVNALGSTLGLLTLLLSTPPILGAGGFVRGLPRATPEERLASLREAERRLQRDHDAVTFVRGPLSTLASAIYVGAASATLVLLEHPVPAFIHAVGGTILAQGRLLLHPTGPIDAWRTYFAHHPDAGCQGPEAVLSRAAIAPRLAIAPSVLGLSLNLTF